MSDDDKTNDELASMLDISDIKAAAIQMHELYTSFREAGFTKSEALEIVIRLTSNGLNS